MVFFFLLTPIGGQSLCKALLENATLEHLILASNEMSEPTAAAMAQVAIHNSTLRKVNLSCNTLGQVSYKQAELVLVTSTQKLICHVLTEPCRLSEIHQLQQSVFVNKPGLILICQKNIMLTLSEISRDCFVES